MQLPKRNNLWGDNKRGRPEGQQKQRSNTKFFGCYCWWRGRKNINCSGILGVYKIFFPKSTHLYMSSTVTQTMNNNPTEKVTFTASNSQADFDLLDIFSNDMDFEQAYDMYNNLQEKTPWGHSNNYKSPSIEPAIRLKLATTIVGTVPRPVCLRKSPNPKWRIQQTTRTHERCHEQNYSFNDDTFDQFFTNTESNALKILDNLANPVASVNPLQFYNNTRTSVPDEDVDLSFELHTMKVPQQFKTRSQSLEHNPPLQQKVRFTEEEHAALKQELTEAFAHPCTQLPSPSTTEYKPKPTTPKLSSNLSHHQILETS